MKKTGLIIILATAMLLAGCTQAPAAELTEEVIATFPVYDEAELATESIIITEDTSLSDKFEAIGFIMISGQYTRNVTEDDVSLTEMFALEKHNFIRIAHSDMEQEVFAYNYRTDDFTYLYYFDGELMTRTKFNIDTGAILEDEAGYADLLMTDAEELKQYFGALLDESGIQISELS